MGSSGPAEGLPDRRAPVLGAWKMGEVPFPVKPWSAVNDLRPGQRWPEGSGGGAAGERRRPDRVQQHMAAATSSAASWPTRSAATARANSMAVPGP